MQAEERNALIDAEADDPNAPGMGAALVTIAVLILTTGVLALLVYIVMIGIVRIEPRYKKAVELEVPALIAQIKLPSQHI